MLDKEEQIMADRLRLVNKNLTDEEIEEILHTKIYFCPGNYEFLPEQQRKKKIKQRDRNYQKFLKETKKD